MNINAMAIETTIKKYNNTDGRGGDDGIENVG